MTADAFARTLRDAGLSVEQLDTSDQRKAAEHVRRLVVRVMQIDADEHAPALVFDVSFDHE